MSRSNTDIINFISEGMTSLEIFAVIKILNEKYKIKKQSEEEEQERLQLDDIRNRISAGEYVSNDDYRHILCREHPGYSRWKDKLSWLNYNLKKTYREGIDDINTWQAYILDYNKNSLKEYFAKKRVDDANEIIRLKNVRLKEIQKQLDEKADAFDITKMDQLPDLVGRYCLSFLSTPETAEQKQIGDENEAKAWRECRYVSDRSRMRPAKFWSRVMSSSWFNTYTTKYKPLIMAKFDKISFAKAKKFLERNSDRLIDLGCVRMSRSTKKIFLEHLHVFTPNKNIEALRFIDCVLRLK